MDSGADSVVPPAAPTAVMVTVGPAGGQVRASGLVLSIPAGALPSMTAVTVAEAETGEELTAEPVTHVYQFGPPGLLFATPVPVTMELVREPAPGEPEPAIYWTNTNGDFEALPTRRVGRTLTADVSHFSVGFGGVGLSSPCAPVTNCGQKRCLCLTTSGERLCSKPNTSCNDEAPWYVAPRSGAPCDAFEFEKAGMAKGVTGLCETVPGQPEYCEIKIPESRYPEAARHIREASTGFPDELTLKGHS